MNITSEQIKGAVERYPRAVTGPMSGCKHPEAVLRWSITALPEGNGCRRLAENYILTGHGACWNAMCNCLPADGWLRWYVGDGAKTSDGPQLR